MDANMVALANGRLVGNPSYSKSEPEKESIIFCIIFLAVQKIFNKV